MLDCQLYGLQPWGHHLTNVLLHATAAVFLFLALRQLTGTQWPSAFVAAVFAIHPLRVGSVAWVAERKDVLSGVFFMLTLWAYARYARNRGYSSSSYTAALVFFALGLMCKPTLVTLPFVLLLVDYWPLRRFALHSPSSQPSRPARNDSGVRRAESLSRAGSLPVKIIKGLLIEKIPFFVLSAALCVATLLVQHRTVMTTHQLVLAGRFANAAVSYIAYLSQMFWPAHLAVYYPFPENTLTIVQGLLASLLLLTISMVFFLWRGKFPFLLVGWLWFLGVLVPMIGIIQVGTQAHADRYTYLAQIGLSVLLTWGAIELLSQWRGGREVLIAMGVLIITALTADSCLQTSYWRNSETLWNQALANTSRNYNAHNGIGDVLMKKGQLDDAIAHFRKGLEITTDVAELHHNLGNALLEKRNWTEAIASYRAALQIDPSVLNTHNNLGISLAEMGKTDEALAEFREALRIDKNSGDAHRNLVILLLRLGRRDEAIVHLKDALRLNPDDPQLNAQLRELEGNK